MLRRLFSLYVKHFQHPAARRAFLGAPLPQLQTRGLLRSQRQARKVEKFYKRLDLKKHVHLFLRKTGGMLFTVL